MKAARPGCDVPVSRRRMLQAGLAAAAVGVMETPAEGASTNASSTDGRGHRAVFERNSGVSKTPLASSCKIEVWLRQNAIPSTHGPSLLLRPDKQLASDK